MRVRIWVRDADENLASFTIRCVPIGNGAALRGSAVALIASVIQPMIDAVIVKIAIIEDYSYDQGQGPLIGGALNWRMGRVVLVRNDGTFGSIELPAISSRFPVVDGGPLLGGGAADAFSFMVGLGIGAVSPIASVVGVALEYGGNE